MLLLPSESIVVRGVYCLSSGVDVRLRFIPLLYSQTGALCSRISLTRPDGKVFDGESIAFDSDAIRGLGLLPTKQEWADSGFKGDFLEFVLHRIIRRAKASLSFYPARETMMFDLFIGDAAVEPERIEAPGWMDFGPEQSTFGDCFQPINEAAMAK